MTPFSYIKNALHPVDWRSLFVYGIHPFLFEAEAGALILGSGHATLSVVGRGRAGPRVQGLYQVVHPEDGSLEETLRTLRRQRQGYLPAVVLGLDSRFLGYRLLIPPDPPPEDLAAYVVSQMGSLLPPGLSLALFTVDYRPIIAHERPLIQVVWARKETLVRLVSQAQAAGFPVIGVYPSVLAIAESLNQEPASKTLLICEPDSLTMAPLLDGLPVYLHEIAWASAGVSADWPSLVSRVMASCSEADPSVVLAGSEESAIPPLLRALEYQGVPVQIRTGSSSCQALACAALEQGFRPFSLLPDPPRPPLQQDRDRRTALRVAGGGAMMLMAGLLIAFILTQYFACEQRRLAGELASHGIQVAQMRRLSALEQTLSNEAAAMKTLQASRRGLAGHLEHLGQTLPERLWLRSVQFTRDPDSGTYRTTLSGFTRSDEALVTFLSNLEQQGVWQPSGLITTGRIAPEAVGHQTGVRAALIRFETKLTTRE